MMPWEIIARSRADELLREAMQAQLVDQIPRPPSRLGAWIKKWWHLLTVVRATSGDPPAEEPLWPRLAGYPYRSRPPG